DNISYSDSGPPADTEPPVWDTTTGIVSAQDTGTGGSVRVDFGMATDTVDGANVDYIVYYAPSLSWSSDWSLNNVALATTVPFTINGLTSDVSYTFGVRVTDQSGNEDGNTNTLNAVPTFTTGSVFFNDFSSDTTSEYVVIDSWIDGGVGSLGYDSAAERMRVLTGDNIALLFSRSLPSLSSGYFSFDFLPTRKYPNGGIITLRLLQDQSNYYEIVYSDGYANRQIRKIVNGVAVESQTAATQYTQNTHYGIGISFSPGQLRISAFGVVQTLSLNNADIQVSGFEIELTQQDGYFDNIYYSDNAPPADTEAPVWDTTSGIVSVNDNGIGGSVTVSFGSATDAVDGSNVLYSIYYAPSSSWSADWEQNSIVSPVTSSYVLTGLTSGIEYTFGVRVSDQSGNEDSNTVSLNAVPGFASGGTVFYDDFSDGNANGWTVVSNATFKTPNWQVVNGIYKQLNDLKGFDQSYHLGTYSYYNNVFPLVDYQVNAKIIPSVVSGQIRDTVGIMFRYADNNNYYRFSMSQFQGFSRLEKKKGGVFTTLAVNGRGPNVNLVQNVSIDVIGSKIFVSVNNEQIFSVEDSDLPSGTIALYAMGQAQFDEVLVSNNTIAEKKLSISLPLAYTIHTFDTETAAGTLSVSALSLNVPPGGGVEFLLDGGMSSGILTAEPFITEYYGVPGGDHTITATMYDATPAPVSGPYTQDVNVQVGLGGKSFVAIGDSITNGTLDDLSGDDNSSDGRNVGRGFTPILNDYLESCLLHPVIVHNEGIGGSKSYEGDDRLASTVDRYPKADYWLILFGTNDALETLFTPSGENCSESDFVAGNSQCQGTYKEYLRSMILKLKGWGRLPLLAKVPFVINSTSEEDARIRAYNRVVDQLVQEHNIDVLPPDLYTHFKNNPSELADHVHPDGQGYISVATLWYYALIDQANGLFECQ
ncbi:MAG: GDSL-type esterase/lipase family protein, partial [Desulforhopalus sp.]